MKTLLALLATLAVTGCGTYGEPLLLAKMFDSADPCQKNPYISYCGAAQGPTVYQRSYRTNRIISTYRLN